MKKIIQISGMTCGHCVARVEKALQTLPGVEGAKVDLKKGQAELKGGVDEGAIRAAVTDAGYTVTGVTEARSGFSLLRA